MSCFNTVLIPCPHCRHPNEHQSKSGDCSMKRKSLFMASSADKVDAEGVHRCCQCKTQFSVELQVIATVTPIVVHDEGDD